MTAIGEELAPGETVRTGGVYVCTGSCAHEHASDIVGYKMPAPPAGCTGGRWVLHALLEPGALDDRKRRFLAAHSVGVLGTVRASGGPQLTQVGYVFDNEAISVCAERHLAKWRNAAREPAVALWVGDGRRQLVVYGRAQLLGSGPARDGAIAAYFAAVSRRRPLDPSSVDAWLREDRGIIRIVPERVIASD